MSTMKKILDRLYSEVEDAAEAGYSNLGRFFDAEGNILDENEPEPENGYLAEAYFDDSDPNNEGWAYRVTPIKDSERQGFQQESGSVADL